ncbi:hypothetical protein MRX96_026459 [Rhipicephalus microplus]
MRVSLIIVYALCVQYEVAADASNGLNSMSEALGGNAPKDNSIEKYYSTVNRLIYGRLLNFPNNVKIVGSRRDVRIPWQRGARR